MFIRNSLQKKNTFSGFRGLTNRTFSFIFIAKFLLAELEKGMSYPDSNMSIAFPAPAAAVKVAPVVRSNFAAINAIAILLGILLSIILLSLLILLLG